MNKYTHKWQIFVVLITVVLLLISALPTFKMAVDGLNLSTATTKSVSDKSPSEDDWISSLGFTPIKLGLDLNGGVMLLYQVDTDKALTDYLQSTFQEARQFVRDNRLHGIKVLFSDNTITLRLNEKQARSSADWLPGLRSQFTDLTIRHRSASVIELSLDDKAALQFHQNLMSHTLSTMRKRIESLGVTEAVSQKQGKSRIRIELPGLNDPAQAEKILGTTATLDVYPLADPSKPYLHKTFKARDGSEVIVTDRPVFSGSNINNASTGRDEMGIALVNLVLDKQGGNSMSAFTRDNIGKPMVTVFSEYIPDSDGNPLKHSTAINIATISQQLGNRFAITNLSSPAEANELATLLNAGAMQAPVTVVERRSINASLGEENASNGFAALAAGLGLTLLFMALWYRKLGLIANLALLINLICLVGLMAWLPWLVLTLPGIAGLVLTVGMAVDTNVLIFERIKYEWQRIGNKRQAIKVGYEKALSTIFDANITTMLCAMILIGIGYGPVKGFAMTLALGLITSMFSGVYVARLLSELFTPDIPFVKQEAKQ